MCKSRIFYLKKKIDKSRTHIKNNNNDELYFFSKEYAELIYIKIVSNIVEHIRVNTKWKFGRDPLVFIMKQGAETLDDVRQQSC